MRRRQRPILLGGLALALFVLVATAGLVGYALSGVAAEARDRHQELADSLFDAMEDELSGLVAVEEQRSFLEYRYYYVPPGNAYKAGLVRSELSRPPSQGWVVGWFQVDPGDVVTSPQVPRDNEVTLAFDNGERPSDGHLDEIRAVLSGVRWSAIPGPAPAAPDPPEPDGSKLLSMRGTLKRAGRGEQVVSTSSLNLSSFNPNQEPVERWADAQAALPPTPDVDVVVGPFQGVRVGDRLVLWRSVHAEGGDHRQGLVVDLPALEQHLEDSAFWGTNVRDRVSIGWSREPPPRAYRFEHRFADPFGSMAAVATVDRMRVGRDALAVRSLAVAVVLAVLGGGLALWRAIRSELEYARRRQDFVAAVSHELKTPLTTIRMYAEMLRDGMVPGADKQRAYHHTITMESERLGRLIANVLELARLERGGGGPEVRSGPAEPLVREAMEIVRPHAEARGFELRLEVDPDLPPVRVERDAVTQIVVNLVDNAVKFAGHGAIELALRPEGAGVALVVRDHGPGVPRAHLAKVFEPFWRGQRELTRTTTGTGIGLALVRGLARRMGGSVRARNHPAGGFEVAVLLAE